MITKELTDLYAKFRVHSPFMLLGHNAEQALAAARTLLRFQELEDQGLVRMRCEPEEENYFDVYGREENERDHKRIEEAIEQLGCWWTASEYFDGHEWQVADSCGMHTGYKNPLSPFENCYVIDEMESAILQAEKLLREPALAFDAACRDIVTE